MASINKRGDKWEVRYELNSSIRGKRVQKRKSGFKTKKEAAAFLAEILNAINNNVYIEPNKMTLAEYLEYWLDDYVRPNLAPNTTRGYEVNVYNHINAKIGHIPLQELKPIHIQQFYTHLKSEGRTDGTGGLSGKSITYVHRVLSHALKYAEKLQLIPNNPARLVKPPRVEKYKASFLDEEQIKIMLEKLRNEEIFIPVMLAVATGLRRGEVLGLMWEDINFEDKTITVKNNLIYHDKKLVLTSLKTEQSQRVISISDNIIKLLKAHRKKQLEVRLLLGQEYAGSNYVCAHGDGRPYNPSSFSHMFKTALKNNNLTHVRFHDLRHVNATLMLKNKIQAKVASERLGHSTIAITLDLYSHVMNEMQVEAAQKIDQAIFDEKMFDNL